MSNNIQYFVKQATEKDKDELIEFSLKTILEHANSITKKEEIKVISYVTNDVTSNLDNYKVIYMDTNKIGCLAIKKEDNDGVLLDKIYLKHEYRNKGIGSDILKKILDENKYVYLWVYKSNKRAISLYFKNGFKVVDETETRFYMKHES